jgi:hypothetical protein
MRDRRGLPDTATGMAEGLGTLITAIKVLAFCVLGLGLIVLGLTIYIAVEVL